jgi:hypothetical protein
MRKRPLKSGTVCAVFPLVAPIRIVFLMRTCRVVPSQWKSSHRTPCCPFTKHVRTTRLRTLQFPSLVVEAWPRPLGTGLLLKPLKLSCLQGFGHAVKPFANPSRTLPTRAAFTLTSINSCPAIRRNIELLKFAKKVTSIYRP